MYRFLLYNGKAANNEEKKWALKPIVTIKKEELFQTIQANLNYKVIV